MGGRAGGGARVGGGVRRAGERRGNAPAQDPFGELRTSSSGISFRATRDVGIEVNGRRVDLRGMANNRFRDDLISTINEGLTGGGKGPFNAEIRRIESGRGPRVRDEAYNQYRDKLYELRDVFPNKGRPR